LSFVGLVVLPALIVTIYYAFVASDQYIVESRFVVRELSQNIQTGARSGSAGSSDRPQQSTQESKTSTSTGSAQVKPATDDAHIITSYIRSRAILDQLLKTIDLRAMYQRPQADFLTRLNGKASIEELEDYWLDKVSTYVEPSGIVVVKVRAFLPDDALVIARAVNTLCAQLADDISRRARQDSLIRASDEVRRADATFRATLIDLETFRDREGLINPGRSGNSTELLMNHLISDRIETENEIFALKRLSPQSFRIAPLNARVDAINARISELKSRLTGSDGAMRTIAASLSKYEELSIREKLAEEMYTLARDGLERARQTAERQWVFLSVFVPPSLPEESLFPRRLAFSALAFAGLVVIWSIGAVTWASILDHLL
jgi:capsular polysaccharide transport system permease protein